jgi:transposase
MERTDLKPATLGLTLAEGKAILKDIQEIVIQRQAAIYLATFRQCPDCGNPRTGKGYHDLSVRTVFGYLKVKCPRLHHCGCRPHESKTSSPLADLLPEHTKPELLFLETKWLR